MYKKLYLLFGFIALLVAIFVSLQFGGSSVNLFSLSETGKNILFNIRIPRILLGISAGLVLASSGGVLQGMLHNPLAEPYLLGISSGAALGSIIGLLLKKIFPDGDGSPYLWGKKSLSEGKKASYFGRRTWTLHYICQNKEEANKKYGQIRFQFVEWHSLLQLFGKE